MKIYEKAIENYIKFSREYYKKLLRIARRDYKKNVKRMLAKGGCLLLSCEHCPVNLAREYYPIVECHKINDKNTRNILNMEVPDNVDVQS